MKKIRFMFALLCSKFTRMVLKLLGKQASFYPGVIALKIDKDYLRGACRFKKIICITGTNGKTTTTNMVSDILSNTEYKIANNKLGANIDTGIATVITNGLSLFCKPKVDILVLETDEKFSRIIFSYIKPDYLIVTNLSRDSIKRNAHSEFIFNILNTYTPKSTKVILNADDLCSSALLKDNKRIFYGIDKMDTDYKESRNIINDYRLCPKCDTKLSYNYLRFHQIANAYCPKCDFKSKNADFKIKNVNYKDNNFTLSYKKKNLKFPIINNSIYNIYNQLAAITFAIDFGISYDVIYKSVSNMKITDTRYHTYKFNDIEVVQTMAKGQNSVACSTTFDYIANEPGDKIVIMMIDDFYERKDSSEFSGWIYDVDFEFLNRENIKKVVAFGPRCYDFQFRILLAGIPSEKIYCCEDEENGLNNLELNGVKKVYILHDTSTHNYVTNIVKKWGKNLENR